MMRHGGVFCCSLKSQCKWQGVVLRHGLAWGVVPLESNAWRRCHDANCEGVLYQLSLPADGANGRIGVERDGTVIEV